VADFRPAQTAAHKLKKDAGAPVVELVPTNDILAGLGARKRPGQILVGFAAETDDLVANATAKLVSKKLDFVVANDVAAPGAGFDHDTNAVTIVAADGSTHVVPVADKRVIADAVLDAIVASLTRPPNLSTHEPTQEPT
jgi:phosphopantothenoylcysteine decarboxylase/phosphopantothenate--cysteine ligase